MDETKVKTNFDICKLFNIFLLKRFTLNCLTLYLSSKGKLLNFIVSILVSIIVHHFNEKQVYSLMSKIKCQILFSARLLIVKVLQVLTIASVLNKNLSKSS